MRLLHLKTVLSVFLALLVCGIAAEARVRLSVGQSGICYSPRIIYDGSGNIHVCWVDAYSDHSGDLMYSRYAAASNQWSTPINLSNSGRVASESMMLNAIGVDSSQRIYVAWGERGYGVRLRTWSGDSWDSAVHVASYGDADYIRMAVDGAGNLFLIWFTWGSREVFSRSRVNGTWEGVRLLSNPNNMGKFPAISTRNGVVGAVFTETVADYQTMYTQRSTGLNASWSAPVAIYSEYPWAAQHPCVQLDSNGTPHVVWVRVDQYDSGNYVTYSWRSGSGFTTPWNLNDFTYNHWPFMAEKNNIIHILWQEGSYYGGSIYYRSGWGSNLSGTMYVADSDGAMHMDLEVSPAGTLGFVWTADGITYFGTASGGGGGGGGGGGPAPPPPPPNQPPTANFHFLPDTGFAPAEIQFDGTLSWDPDGIIVQHNWQFGDGNQATGGNVFHTYQTQGIFQVKLTVVDNGGLTASVVKPIEILGVYPPRNVRWQTFVDESVFLTRYVTEVTWEKNPQNDRFNIVTYRVHRKNQGESGGWKCIGQTTADVFRYLDTDVKQKDIYAYSITAVDSEGHESRIGAQADPPSGGEAQSFPESPPDRARKGKRIPR
ncbi:MAG: PKD domain-containing protein [Candidatus Aminicenantes bacterium]|nr:PKD domain-containing protein [Candidatus Aminicenantes bacterium]